MLQYNLIILTICGLISSFTSISAVLSYAVFWFLREGRDFAQWTEDDSKALMKVVSSTSSSSFWAEYFITNRFILLPLLAMYPQKWSSACQHLWSSAIYFGEM